jgi:PhzF family phenazine biosynthesis protein
MKITFYQVNAFSDKLFSGNPAAVVILDEWLSDLQLQLIARENYLPATAYLVRKNDGYETRWFTPEYEIDLCGHGTLASAFIIFSKLKPDTSEVNLYHSSGTLHVKKANDFLTLVFPVKSLEAYHSDLLNAGLNIQSSEIYQHKSERCLVILDSEEAVRALKPDMQILQKLPHRGIIVTAAGSEYDYISRTFYPKKAASEDAVTGSSQCLLVPYWANKLSKTRLHSYQASHRGGEVVCELKGDRVEISGRAKLYSAGTINLS